MSWQELIADQTAERKDIELGGGERAIERQHKKDRLTARERIRKLLDSDSFWQEVGLWAWQSLRSNRNDHRQRRDDQSGCVLPNDL